MARRWIRLWVNEFLHSSAIWDLTDAEVGVFFKLLALAGSCRTDGLIAAGDENRPYPDEWVATTLNIPMPLFKTAVNKLVETQRIEFNGNGISICKWAEYQSEYDRQKPYRFAAKTGPQKNTDPDKYIKGIYGHMVKRGKTDDK